MILRHQHSRKSAWRLGLACVLGTMLAGFFSPSAMAVELNFNISTPSSGSVSYDGTGGGLIGSNIEVDNVVGLFTSANANVTSLCFSCVLNFNSGGLTGAGGPPLSGNNNGWWRFGSGGSITITGGVQLQGSTDIPTGTTLLSGTFDNAFVQDLGSAFKVTFGSFTDTKHPDLLAHYGLAPSPFEGALTLLFGSVNGGVGEAFTSTLVFSGSVANTPVPVPAAVWLFGSGVVAFAGLARRTGLFHK